MKRFFALSFVITILLLASLTGCNTESVPAVTQSQPAENTPPTTNPQKTEPPETTAPPFVETEPTQPPRTWIPQDPDADDEIQATLLFYVGGLYVHDNREDAVTETLPEGYFYAASTVMEDNYSIPEKVLWACHIPDLTAVYAYEENPDYIYYTLESGGKTVYRRMIRAALVENYWGGESLDETLPEDYRLMLFQVMISNFKVGIYNPYGQIEGHEFATPQDVDLYTLFYNGFADLRQNVLPLTDEERQFLLASGQWGEGPGREKQPIGNAIRIPISRMDEMLRRYFGIGFADTDQVGKEKWDTYWAEKQCYYTWRSDFNAGFATVTAVEVDGDIYRIRYFHSDRRADVYIMTLERVGNVLQIRSNEKWVLTEQKARELIDDYFYQRFAFLKGDADAIATANEAMIEDELLHREKILAAELELIEYSLVIEEISCGDAQGKAIVKETIVYMKNGQRISETVEHRLWLGLNYSGIRMVSADGYRMEGSDFTSCSYVPPEILAQVES